MRAFLLFLLAVRFFIIAQRQGPQGPGYEARGDPNARQNTFLGFGLQPWRANSKIGFFQAIGTIANGVRSSP